jgi:hypothetical protein
MRREENHVTRRVMNMNVDGEDEVDQKMMDWHCEAGYGRWLWVRKWRVIEENDGRGHAAPTPNELGKGQEEEEEYTHTYHSCFIPE